MACSRLQTHRTNRPTARELAGISPRESAASTLTTWSKLSLRDRGPTSEILLSATWWITLERGGPTLQCGGPRMEAGIASMAQADPQQQRGGRTVISP